jgi:hippurate hydrolase
LIGFWTHGCIDPQTWDELEAQDKLEEGIPMNHSATFALAIMPTLSVDLSSYAVAALTWLKKE